MTGQLHITHREDYFRGKVAGQADGRRGTYYPPARGDSDSERAYRLGYSDGWEEGYPCANRTCVHRAHNPNAA